MKSEFTLTYSCCSSGLLRNYNNIFNVVALSQKRRLINRSTLPHVNQLVGCFSYLILFRSVSEHCISWFKFLPHPTLAFRLHCHFLEVRNSNVVTVKAFVDVVSINGNVKAPEYAGQKDTEWEMGFFIVPAPNLPNFVEDCGNHQFANVQWFFVQQVPQQHSF